MIKSRLKVRSGSLLPYLGALIALASAALVFFHLSITSGSYYAALNSDRWTKIGVDKTGLEQIGWLVMAGGLVLTALFMAFAAKKKLALMILPLLVYTAGVVVNLVANITDYAYILVLTVLFGYFFLISAINVLHNKYISCIVGLVCFVGVAVFVYLNKAPFVFFTQAAPTSPNFEFGTIGPCAGYFLSMVLLVLSLENEYNLDAPAAKDKANATASEPKPAGKKNKKEKTPEELADEIMKQADKENKKTKKKNADANWALLGQPGMKSTTPQETPVEQANAASSNDGTGEPAMSEEEVKRRQKEREARELREARERIEASRKRVLTGYQSMPIPEDPILKEEEERKKQEEEQRKAEEARLQAEAEAKRKEEAERAKKAEEEAAAAAAAMAAAKAAEEQKAFAESSVSVTEEAAEPESNVAAEATNAEPVLTVPITGTKLQKTLKEDIVYDRDQKLMYKRKVNAFSIIGLILSVLCILVGAVMITKIVDVAALQNDNLGIPMIAIGLFMICVFGTRLTYKEYYTKTIVTERKVVREETNWEEVLASRIEEDEKSIQSLTDNLTRMSDMYSRLVATNAELAKGIEQIHNAQLAGPSGGQAAGAFSDEAEELPTEQPEEYEELSEAGNEEPVGEDENEGVALELNLPDGELKDILAEEAPVIGAFTEEIEESIPAETEEAPASDPYSIDSIIAEEPQNDYLTAFDEKEENADEIFAAAEEPEETVFAAAEETFDAGSEPAEETFEATTENAFDAAEETITAGDEEITAGDDVIEASEDTILPEEEPVTETVNSETEAYFAAAEQEEAFNAAEETFAAAEEPFAAAMEEETVAAAEPAEEAFTAVRETIPEETLATVEEPFAAAETLEEAVTEAIPEETPAPEPVTAPAAEEKPQETYGVDSDYTGYNASLISSMFSRYRKKEEPKVETPAPEPVKEEPVVEPVAEPVEEIITAEEPIAETAEEILAPEEPIAEAAEEIITPEETVPETFAEEVITAEEPIEEAAEEIFETAEETVSEAVQEEEPVTESEPEASYDMPKFDDPELQETFRKATEELAEQNSEEEEESTFTLPTFRGFQEDIAEESEENSYFRGFGYNSAESNEKEEEPTLSTTAASYEQPVTDSSEEDEDNGIIEGFVLPTFRGFINSDEEEEQTEIKPSKPLSSEPKKSTGGFQFFRAETYGNPDEPDEPEEETTTEPELPEFNEEIPESTYDLPEDEEEPEEAEPVLPTGNVTPKEDHQVLTPEEERRKKLQEKLAQIYSRNRQRQQEEAAKDNFDDLNFDDSPVVYFRNNKNDK